MKFGEYTFDLIVEVVTCDNRMIGHRKFIHFVHYHFRQLDKFVSFSICIFINIQQKEAFTKHYFVLFQYAISSSCMLTNISNSVSQCLRQMNCEDIGTFVCLCEQWDFSFTALLFHSPTLCIFYTLPIFAPTKCIIYIYITYTDGVSEHIFHAYTSNQE